MVNCNVETETLLENFVLLSNTIHWSAFYFKRIMYVPKHDVVMVSFGHFENTGSLR